MSNVTEQLPHDPRQTLSATERLRESSPEAGLLCIELASAADRQTIYHLRHDVFAREIGQHAENAAEELHDQLDEFNHYIVARRGTQIVGFISITPPTRDLYSIDKYLDREQRAELQGESLYEVRLLTVVASQRKSSIAALLLYAAYRWLQVRQAQRIVAIGRLEVLDIYRKIGFRTQGLQIQSGQATFELLAAPLHELEHAVAGFQKSLRLLERTVAWQLDFPYFPEQQCYHGGASVEAAGPAFDRLAEAQQVINADVLDAWFSPPPAVLHELREHLPWLARTSPPTECEGLRCAIAERRGVPLESIVVGAGSSDLIYRAFGHWLGKHSKVLIVDPCYGEYEFVLRHVIGCKVDRLLLRKRNGYRLGREAYREAMRANYDLVIAVNPNNPTGAMIEQDRWQELLALTPRRTRLWIDECYIDYVDSGESLEPLTAARGNLVVCKSLSKALALSGLRVGYLCLAPALAAPLRLLTPPWAVGLPGQFAAVRALAEPEYYRQRYAETHRERQWLERQLSDLGCEVIPGRANFFLAFLGASMPPTEQLLAACRERNLFLREVYPTSPSLGRRAIRVAVKSPEMNRRMISILSQLLGGGEDPASSG